MACSQCDVNLSQLIALLGAQLCQFPNNVSEYFLSASATGPLPSLCALSDQPLSPSDSFNRAHALPDPLNNE